MTQLLVPSDISKYRQLLMGVAIIGVMAAHWFGFQFITTGFFYDISQILAKLVFTEGLLFLSGFGLYYSFSRNTSLSQFYKKRMVRLYLPFLLLSFPLYLYFLIIDEHYSILIFFEQLTTSYFWFNGNFGGMWYVSISIALYIIFPLFYSFIIKTEKSVDVTTKTLLVVAMLFLFNYIISRLNENYYSLVYIGLSKTPMFVLGIAFGFFVKNDKISSRQYILLLMFILFVYVILSLFFKNNILGQAWIGMVQKFIFMPVLCLIFKVFDKSKFLSYCNSIIGWFGKYSLELYILHLHLFMFLLKCPLFQEVPLIWKASLAISLALILSVPTNKLLAYMIQRVKIG